MTIYFHSQIRALAVNNKSINHIYKLPSCFSSIAARSFLLPDSLYKTSSIKTNFNFYLSVNQQLRQDVLTSHSQKKERQERRQNSAQSHNK